MLARTTLLICLANLTLFGQGQPSGVVRGTVTNPDGIAVPNASITIADSQGRTVAGVRSNAAGSWEANVPSGRYNAMVAATGFSSRQLADLDVPGEPVLLILIPQENAEIADGKERDGNINRPVVDVERTNPEDYITSRELLNLPINRRNYLDLAAYTPGVSLVNDYIGLTDLPSLQSPGSGLSFGGNNGRGNVFWLDGGENYINTGGVRPSISQEAVAEFHVDRSNYSAEFGGGIGGIVNIVSKSGSDDLHGNLFGFLRQRAIQARNYFDPEKTPFTRTQAGTTLGGAIRRNRTHFFAGFERLQRQESSFVAFGKDWPSFRRLKRTQDEIVDFLSRANTAQLRQLGQQTQSLLLTTNYPRTIDLFNSNRGVFPFSERNSVGSIRFDHRFSDNHNAFLRINTSAGSSRNSQIEGLNAFSRGVVSDFSDQTLLLNDVRIISSRLVSESRLSLNRTRFNAANVDRIGPSIEIDNYGLFGKHPDLPSDYGEWHGQLQQNFFFTPGRHSIRFGADVNPVRTASLPLVNSGGRFSFGENMTLGAFYNFITKDPSTERMLSTLLGGPRSRLGNNLDVTLTAIQAFNVGAPRAYIQGFGNPSWSGWFQRYNLFVNDVYRLHPRLTLNMGVRQEIEIAPDELGSDDRVNFAPRMGIAWAATKDRKTVVRAGYGLFYLRHQSQLAIATETQSGKNYNQIVVPLTGLPGSRNPLTGMRLTSADVYSTLFAQGVIGRRQIQASDLAQFGLRPGSDTPFQILFQRPVDFSHAFSQQSSFEIERAFGGTAISLAYNFTRAAHLPRLRDVNLLFDAPTPNGVPRYVNPLIAQSLRFESAANSFYHGTFVRASRRFSQSLTFNASYTFSKSIDEVTDLHFLPNDSRNARAERGLSTFDQRHRVVGGAAWVLPSLGKRPAFVRALLGGYLLAPIVNVSSGRPFNVVLGQDTNSKRPLFAGRNIGRGPAFSTIDARLSRVVPLGERLKLEFIAEGFNLLNHTNFRRLYNTVEDETAGELPRPLVGVRGDPTKPLGFVSAFDPRQLQLALKLRW